MAVTSKEWSAWLSGYGAKRFFNLFQRVAADAESICVQCRRLIYLDMAEGGGGPDWRTSDGDYGCGDSPDTGEDGTGSHVPRKLRR